MPISSPSAARRLTSKLIGERRKRDLISGGRDADRADEAMGERASQHYRTAPSRAQERRTDGRIKGDGCAAASESRGEAFLVNRAVLVILCVNNSGRRRRRNRDLDFAPTQTLKRTLGTKCGQAGQTSWTGGSSCRSVQRDHPGEDSNYPLGKAVSRPH